MYSRSVALGNARFFCAFIRWERKNFQLSAPQRVSTRRMRVASGKLQHFTSQNGERQRPYQVGKRYTQKKLLCHEEELRENCRGCGVRSGHDGGRLHKGR
jgi:hypothetical protein